MPVPVTVTGAATDCQCGPGPGDHPASHTRPVTGALRPRLLKLELGRAGVLELLDKHATTQAASVPANVRRDSLNIT